MEKGKLIVVEGSSDGIGKTTQYSMLKNHLEADGKEIISHHFPSYHTYQGEPVTRYLSGEYGEIKDLSPYFINSLYAIDRGITWYTELKPLYDQGKIVLLDRYTTSSMIYQSALIDDIRKKKQFVDFVADFEYEKIGLKKPDNVIFLYAPFDMIQKMIEQRSHNEGVSNDIYERDMDIMKRVYNSAMFVADYLSWDKVQCNDGDQMKSREEIHEEVYQLIKRKK